MSGKSQGPSSPAAGGDGLPLWTAAHAREIPGVRRDDGNYRLRESRLAFDGRLIKVFKNKIRLPNGHEADHEIILQRGAVSIIPVLEEVPGKPEIILVEQFRSTLEGYIHEIPAGVIDPGEDPLDCARRELLEETGWEAERWTHVATIFPTPGIAVERMHYYLAEGLRRAGDQQLEPGECLHVRRFPLEGLLESMALGRSVPGIPTIVDGKTWIGVLYLAARRGLPGPGEEARR